MAGTHKPTCTCNRCLNAKLSSIWNNIQQNRAVIQWLVEELKKNGTLVIPEEAEQGGDRETADAD